MFVGDHKGRKSSIEEAIVQRKVEAAQASAKTAIRIINYCRFRSLLQGKTHLMFVEQMQTQMKHAKEIGIYDIYKGKKVLITGHTGFKGSWLALWLKELGANVFGYALDPPTNPSLFELLSLENEIDHEIGDVRDMERLKKRIQGIKPDIIFHLAAQSLVGKSYEEPLETVQVNTLGTVNLMEVIRQTKVEVA